MTNVFSWKNSVSLCPTSFCTPRPNLFVTPGISWFPTFAFQSPLMKRTSFFGVSSRRSWRSSENCSTSASSALVAGAQAWITQYWTVCTGNEQRSFCCFQDKSNSYQDDKGVSLLRDHTPTRKETPEARGTATGNLQKGDNKQQAGKNEMTKEYVEMK